MYASQAPVATCGVVCMQGLDTFSPGVRLPDGTVCSASYEDTVGTCMVFGSSGGGGGADISTGKAHGSGAMGSLEYLCCTERLLRVHNPPPFGVAAPVSVPRRT